MPLRVMEAGYKYISYFFGLVAAVTYLGFYEKYFGLIPDFPGVGHIHHLHAISLSIWLTILIIQPVLIIRKYTRIHRLIGKFSYVLVPFMLLTMILVYHHQYLRLLSSNSPESESLAFVFSPMTDAIPFLIFYVLGIAHRRDTAKHMRYMISTGIVIGGPGLGRVFMHFMDMDIFTAIAFMSLITLIVFVALIIYDRIKGKKFTINPFTIALIIWLVPNTLITFFPSTDLWQSIAKWMVTTI